MYKVIISDLDETLLGSDKKVSEKNRRAIQKARELGVKFVPASGRGYTMFQDTLRELGLYDEENEYSISYNGGIITENKGNKALFYEPLDKGKAKELFERGLEYGFPMHIYTKEDVYIYGPTPEEAEYVNGRLDFIEYNEDSLDFFEDKDILKLLYVNTDYEKLKECEKEMADVTGDLEVSYSAGRYLEFNPKGVNKGSGLLHLSEILGVKPEEIVAVGDNINDLSMIEAAGLGVGVQNTNEDMKGLCDVVTEATNDEDAIAEVIEKFVIPSIKEGPAL